MKLSLQVWLLWFLLGVSNMLLITPLNFITSSVFTTITVVVMEVVCFGCGWYFQKKYVEDELTIEVNQFLEKELKR